MGYRGWDETAWLDRIGEWVQAHRAVRVVWFSMLILIVLGLDFSSLADAVPTWIILGLLVVAVIILIMQLVRSARRRTRDTDGTEEERA